MEKLASVIAVAELALEFVFAFFIGGRRISQEASTAWPTKKPDQRLGL